jgi:hypothetical protein
MQRMLIDLPENGTDAIVSLINGDIITKRVISTGELLSNMAASYNFSTGIQPKGTRFFSGSPSRYIIGIETPPMVRPFYIVSPARRREVGDNYVPKRSMIPIPYCLFVFNIINKTLKTTYVYSLKNPVRSEDDELYRFPFGNTHQKGNVCWGTVKQNTIKKPMETLVSISAFLDSTYNGDLFDSSTIMNDIFKKRSNMTDKNIHSNEDIFWGLVKYLNGEEVFPIDLLHPIGKNIKDIMRQGDD